MCVTYCFSVFVLCQLLVPQARSVQLRLANSDNKDNSRDANYYNQKPDSYSYNYDIADQGTGDSKAKWEKRENNVVRGAYSVVEPDGSTRLVEYTADANGFRPVITNLGAASPAGNLAPAYNTRTSDLTYSHNLYNQRIANGNYNNYNDRGRNVYPASNAYGRSLTVNGGYNNGYYNRPSLTGYDSYRGYDGVSGVPYQLPPLRQDRQPVPLLHSTYHGYDNLYH